MEALLALVYPLLAEAAKVIYPRYPWVEEFFPENKMERLAEENLTIAQQNHQENIAHRLRDQDKFVNKWKAKAQNSPTPLVKESADGIALVASMAFALQHTGVTQLTIYDSDNINPVISGGAFQTSAEETITAIAEFAKSNADVLEVAATCRTPGPNGFEVVAPETNACRRLCILLCLRALQCEWPPNQPIYISPQEGDNCSLDLEKKIYTQWMTMEEQNYLKREIKERVDSISFEQLANLVFCSTEDCNTDLMNVFVVGAQGAGRSTTTRLLRGNGRNSFAAGRHFEKHITDETDERDGSRTKHIAVWDTPGFRGQTNFDIQTKEDIVHILKAAVHLKVVILQASSPEEIYEIDGSILKTMDTILENGLIHNLMVVLKIAPDHKNREQHVAAWEKGLEGTLGYGIGEENYIFFGPNSDGRFSVDSAKVKQAKRKIMRKSCCAAKRNAMACVAQEHNRRSQVRDFLLSRHNEKSGDIKTLLQGKKHIRARYDDGDLKIWVPDRLCKKSRNVVGFTLRGVCEESMRELKQMEKKIRERRLKPWKAGKASAIEIICSRSVQFVTLTPEPMGSQPLYYVYATKEKMAKACMDIAVDFLGMKRMLDVLECNQIPENFSHGPSITE